jgi:subtilisin family serine protease
MADDTPIPPTPPDNPPDDDEERQDPFNLIRAVIAVPLQRHIDANPAKVWSVIIDVNFRHAEGRGSAKNYTLQFIEEAICAVGDQGVEQGAHISKTSASQHYVYARLQGKVIRALVERDRRNATRSIFHVWPDFEVRAQIWRSVPTVKADACRRAFAADGKGILWAVLDSGIDARHPHFDKHENLKKLPPPVTHMDFTADPPAKVDDPTDDYGHGTHVAGIIAGELDGTAPQPPVAIARERDATGKITYQMQTDFGTVAGVATECKLASFKVLDKNGTGLVSNVIAAIEKIQEINGYGREIIIHGVNLSLGYDFEAEWFACGQSPVCVEVDRLVRSGVCVVIAAGNTGQKLALTINDPGNAELAITVGATHRDMPHTYGVSYFSSKGPTGDGRRKPDLLAPGEKIVSCGAGPDLNTFKTKAGVGSQDGAYYIERTGTSMAAPHVSGIIAGLLSVRGEFIGRPMDIKKILMDNATDLGRDPVFQGRGLIDMMRAIQAI